MPESDVTATLRVYSRPGCHLCEVLLEELLPLVRGRASVVVVDIDQNVDQDGPGGTYGTRIPVVELDGRVLCEYRLDRQAVETGLARRRSMENASGPA
jgi:hypothetical protein